MKNGNDAAHFIPFTVIGKAKLQGTALPEKQSMRGGRRGN
jgi:hypothetical protein